ncbi:M20/M25/M40 family metallo-hydrolase [Gelidibacter salicanalis]|uniref:M20/M25/M40 family metallo-hydrolase n=1 Tax=Gelidibacter salicanalis TaxID=291193 RepID=A0A934KQT0_9FLAO|nr:M20/M25/M40 family metallo-hydrolase [Gelidibacter salicanalis]MBJ7882124.1 M20/M25/M40 family metallo-hydrolase [Gelidibacter salicanalis]
MRKTLLFLLISTLCFSGFSQSDITENELKDHISFLASEKNAGRFPGTKANRAVVSYIQKDFKKQGLLPLGKSYRQKFKAKLRVAKGVPEKRLVKTSNVVAFVEGTDPLLKDEYIILGAHYDHLGMGGPSSKSDQKNTIHYGADDNASGTAALLEIAEKIAANKQSLKRSVIFIAFGAEEQGLLGSQYFVDNPLVPLTQIKLMINMDMVGRLNTANHVYMNGAGTFPGGVALLQNLGESLGLTPVVHAGSVGGSDHVSFYKAGLSVLGIHTGAHPQYHRPEDTVDLINFPGHKQVSDFIYTAIMQLATTNYKMEFIPQD